MADSYSVEAVLKAVDANFTSTMEQAVQSLGEVVRANSSMNNQIASSSNASATASSRLTSGFKEMAGALGLVAVASKAFGVLRDSIGGAVERFDTLNKFPVVMQALGYSARDTAKSTAILKKGVDGLPTTLQDVTSVAQQLAPLTGSATKASQSAIALNNAFLASGASAADSSRGLQQYTQMLSTGKVDMMSWRTLMETMPIALRKVANSFGFTGKSAENDLYKALQSGQITMDQLNDRFIKLNKGQNGFAELAKKNSAGIMTSFTNLKNSVKNNLAEMLTDINQGFKNAGLGSIAQQLDNLKGVINNTFKAIGPAVTVATTAIIGFAQTVGGVLSSIFNNDWFRPLIVGVAGFVGALKGIEIGISIFSRLKDALVVGKTFVQLAMDAKNLVGVFKNLAVLMGVNPWVMLAAAIVAVVGALVYFFTQTKTGRALWSGFVSFLSGLWQQLVTTATTVWNNIVTVFTTAVSIIKGIWSGISTFFSTIWNAIVTVASATWQVIVTVVTTVVTQIKSVWQGIVAFFTTLWTGIVTVATTIWNMIVAVVTTVVAAVQAAWSGFSAFMSALWSGIVTVTSAVWNGIVSVISAVWSTITSVISGAVSAVRSVISAGFNAARTAVSTVMNAMKAIISTIWNDIKGLFRAGVNFIKSVVHVDLSAQGRAIMQSFFNGLKSVWNGIKSFVSGIAGWIKSHKGPISYDAKLLIPAGQAIMQGLNNGLIAGFTQVQSNVSSMAERIAQAAMVEVPKANTSAVSASLNALDSQMQNSSMLVKGRLSTNNTITAGSRLFEGQITELVQKAITKLDNVDQHPVVDFDTAQRMRGWINKENAHTYLSYRG